MKKSTSDKSRGIHWDLLSHLEDLDFADDLAIFFTNLNNMQEKSSLVNNIQTKQDSISVQQKQQSNENQL